MTTISIPASANERPKGNCEDELVWDALVEVVELAAFAVLVELAVLVLLTVVVVLVVLALLVVLAIST